MDTRTGQIVERASIAEAMEDMSLQQEIEGREKRKRQDEMQAKFVQEIDEVDMTPKQKANRKVNPKDHKSPLGKRLGAARNKPCPCGSGLKLKRCCWRKQI